MNRYIFVVAEVQGEVAGETFGADAGAGGVEGAVEGAGCEGVDFEAEFGGEGEETWGGHLGGGVGGKISWGCVGLGMEGGRCVWMRNFAN